MKKVILAGMEKKNGNEDFGYAMKETQNLCEACGYDVVATISQKSYSADPKTAFRKGKVDELAALVKDTEAELVIFHNGLSIQTAQRLSSILGVNVIDRTALILDIFSKRARSKQAKLQTELARLQYDLPQLLMDNQDSSGHERGGSALNRGAGEMRSQVIERRYAKRMNELKKELSKIKEQHYRDERRRTKTLMKRVGLVGYTNAGKSSLMNLLLEDANAVGKEVYSEDMLFATLDTSVRNIRISSYRFLLYDTVGFVSNLPHTLIEAFQSTLDAARDADLLLHIIDISDKDYEAKIQITEDCLKEIGAGDIPILRIYNKVDLYKSNRENDLAYISCKTKEGLEEIKERIIEKLFPQDIVGEYFLPYNVLSLMHDYQTLLKFTTIEHKEDGMLVEIAGEEKYMHVFEKYKVKGEYDEKNSMGKA